jgi:glycosyltransferase involved in cell wall biosynthesis
LPDIPLVVIGEGGFLAEARTTASENVRFVGFKKGSDLYTLVGGAVASILPAEAYENCPVSILESFALGRPVIGSRIGGIPELIEDGEDGYLFEPGNVDALTQSIEAAWRQRASKALGKAARVKAEQQFSADVHYRRIRDVYDSVYAP